MEMLHNLGHLPVNPEEPKVMHIDMNSCFATVEQQANPLLRGRPIAVAPYVSPKGIIIAPSVEAKELGIKLGTRVFEAKEICPDIVVLPPDPPKYRDAYQRLTKVFTSYTSDVTPKSIDEAVINFEGARVLTRKPLIDIGKEIKERVKEEVGEWMRVSVGMGTNRFLAKTAAGINKPDGLDLVSKSNLLDTYKKLELTDLTGINVRYEARLKKHGIKTPFDLFNTPLLELKRQVFKSIAGYHWYMRLRGWEVDNIDFGRKSFGHTYALGKKTSNREDLSQLLMKLCEKTGRRLRRGNYFAQGVHVSISYTDRSRFNKGGKTKNRLYTTKDIYLQAQGIMNSQPEPKVVAHLAVSVFNLSPHKPLQTGLFDGTRADQEALARSLDDINDRYGEFTVVPAQIMAMDDTILDRIAFGNVRELNLQT